MRAPLQLLFFLVLAVVAVSGVPTLRVANDSEENMCPVHHVPLKKEKLEIAYGLIPDEPCNADRRKAAKQYFPFANSVVYGGCVILPNSPKYEEVPYCPKCRELEKTWRCLETSKTPIVTTFPAPRVTRLPTRP
jgi:hypothetical protein